MIDFIDFIDGLQVMFRNAHVRELQPEDWQQQLIGSGAN